MGVLLHRSDKIVIEFEPTENWIYTDWIGTQSEKDIRAGGLQMIQAMKDMHAKNRCTKVLNDNRRVTGLWGHSVEWAEREWLPEMVAAGLKSFAWVLAKESLTNLSGLRLRLKASESSGDLMMAYSDIEEAKKWLLGRAG
jgi:hypothetical protein